MFGNKTITTHTETRTMIVRLDHPCTHDKLVVKQQPDATARLRVLEAECDKFVSRVVLAIENVGVKPIRGYEVGIIQQYEYKKNVESSQAVMSDWGITLAVGEIRTLNSAVGSPMAQAMASPQGHYRRACFGLSASSTPTARDRNSATTRRSEVNLSPLTELFTSISSKTLRQSLCGFAK